MTATVLFDAPGPRARRRNLMLTVIGALVVAGLITVAVLRLAGNGQFTSARWNWLQYKKIQQDLVSGLLATLKAFGLAAVLALFLGFVLSVGRLARNAAVRWTATVIVTVFRALPVIVLMFFPYVVSKPWFGTALPLLWCVVFGLTIYNGSVLAEIFRAGVLSVPRGQGEAASSIGLGRRQTLQLVLFPQAIRAMLPTIISQLVVVLKDTALGFLIGYHELLYQGNSVTNGPTFKQPFIPVAIVVGAIYVVLCGSLSIVANFIERRTGGSRVPRRRFQQGSLVNQDAAPLDLPPA